MPRAILRGLGSSSTQTSIGMHKTCRSHEARPERDRLATGAAPRPLRRAGHERHDAMAVLRGQLDLLRQRPVTQARDAVRPLRERQRHAVAQLQQHEDLVAAELADRLRLGVDGVGDDQRANDDVVGLGVRVPEVVAGLAPAVHHHALRAQLRRLRHHGRDRRPCGPCLLLLGAGREQGSGEQDRRQDPHLPTLRPPHRIGSKLRPTRACRSQPPPRSSAADPDRREPARAAALARHRPGSLERRLRALRRRGSLARGDRQGVAHRSERPSSWHPKPSFGIRPPPPGTALPACRRAFRSARATRADLRETEHSSRWAARSRVCLNAIARVRWS